jgi:hypothetical protein
MFGGKGNWRDVEALLILPGTMPAVKGTTLEALTGAASISAMTPNLFMRLL